MDVQQLRSWIFELFDPLTQDRTYIVFERDGALLIDLPPYQRRALLRIIGTCDPALVFFTHAGRARDADKWREALPDVRFAIHGADASGVAGGVDLALKDGDALTPLATVVHVGAHTPGASAVLVRRQGGVLFSGDAVVGTPDGRLRLPDEAYAPVEKVRAGIEKLRTLEFSSVLSTHGTPIWNAGKDEYLALLNELPKPKRRFGYLTDTPWDLAYRGRLQDQMVHNPIMPEAHTIAEAAAHGPSTLVPAWEKKTDREVTWAAAPPFASPKAEPPATDGKKWSLAHEAPTAHPARPRGPVETIPGEAASVGAARFRRLEAAELAEVPAVDLRWRSLDLSRDGSEVVFAWNASGGYEIYRAPIEGEAIFRLTSAERRSVQPRFSPNGRTIAFLRDEDGNERFAVWLVDRDGARERRLGEGTSAHRSLAWSPDGRRLALVSDAEGAVAIWTVEVETGVASRLASELGPGFAAEPVWSRDGRFIAYQAGAEVFVVPADGSTAPWRVETNGRAFQPRWSPRDDALAFVMDTRGRLEIALVPMRNGRAVGAPRHLREAHFDDFDPVWQPEGDRLLYHRAVEGAVVVRRAYTKSLNDEPVLDAPGVHLALGVRPDDATVYLWSGPAAPADVYVKGRGDIAPRAITRSLPGSISAELLVTPRHVSYPGADGVAIPALLYIPHAGALDGDRPPPAVVYAHDGPAGGQHTLAFDVWAQWFANQGYVVLAPNVRGSGGYGRAYLEADREPGGADLRDLLAGARWLASEGIADAGRLAAFGVGYGGYLALLALAEEPDRFHAGASLNGLASTSKSGRSPLAAVDRIRAPVLLLEGRNHPSADLAEAKRFVEAARATGIAFSFHVYDDGGRWIERSTARHDALERGLQFFDEHVKGREPIGLGPSARVDQP